MDDRIVLIHPGCSKDADIRKEIFAELKSTGRDENTSAGQAGYKDTQRFLIWSVEYDNQKVLEYRGKRLTIYRTYKVDNDKLELYAGERIGNRVY